ncbi:MAG: hypothetical protein MPJ08_08260 [Nitrosopumilus sp.]|nr:hypothetical protein [Nitrosopumilus sp.]
MKWLMVAGMIVSVAIAAIIGLLTLEAVSQPLDYKVLMGDHSNDGIEQEADYVDPQMIIRGWVYILIVVSFFGFIIVLYITYKSRSRMGKNKSGSTGGGGLTSKGYALLLFSATKVGIGGCASLVLYLGPGITLSNMIVPITWIVIEVCHLVLEATYYKSKFDNQKHRRSDMLERLSRSIAIFHVILVIVYPIECHPTLQAFLVLIQVGLAIVQAVLAFTIVHMRKDYSSWKSQWPSYAYCGTMWAMAFLLTIAYSLNIEILVTTQLSLATALFSLFLTKPIIERRSLHSSYIATDVLDEITGRWYHKLTLTHATAVIGITTIIITGTFGAYILTALLEPIWAP